MPMGRGSSQSRGRSRGWVWRQIEWGSEAVFSLAWAIGFGDWRDGNYLLRYGTYIDC